MTFSRHTVMLLPLLAVLISGFATVTGWAATGTMEIEAILVWATNEQKPSGKELKDLEPGLEHKLSKSPYKWKNYYEVERRRESFPVKTSKTLSMSKHCSLEIMNLGDERVEVKLVGQGKPVSRNVEALPPGHTMILGGDAKNDTAWLIVLRQTKKKN